MRSTDSDEPITIPAASRSDPSDMMDRDTYPVQYMDPPSGSTSPLLSLSPFNSNLVVILPFDSQTIRTIGPLCIARTESILNPICSPVTPSVVFGCCDIASSVRTSIQEMPFMNDLISHISNTLTPFNFVRMDDGTTPPSLSDGIETRALWKRKTFNTNRGVALLEYHESVPEFLGIVRDIVKPLGKTIGYIPFLYPLGLQVIAVGKGMGTVGTVRAEEVKKVLSKIDNQRVLLQSIHLVDLETMSSASARTWGQAITGKFQDAIEQGIGNFLGAGK